MTEWVPIARWEGIIFLAYYVVYTVYLYLTVTQHTALDEFGSVLFYFVIPLTLITFVVSVMRELRQWSAGVMRDA